MNRNTRKAITGSLLFLAATLLFAILSQAVMFASAQGDEAVVIIPDTIGGTTDPVPGTYSYANGSTFVLTASADAGYTFQYWAISGNYTPGHETQQPTVLLDPDTGQVIGQIPRATVTGIDNLITSVNPLNVSHGFGYTYVYEAVFVATSGAVTPSATPTNETTGNLTAIVIMQPAIGGTTSPAAGTYEYANGTNFVLSATPNPGYVFQYWLISGNVTPGHTQIAPTLILDPDTGAILGEIPRPSVTGIDSLVLTANPANVSHGYGYTYSYQAVFAQVTSPSPSPSQAASPTASAAPTATASPSAAPTSTPSPSGGFPIVYVVIIVVVIIIIIIAVAAIAMRRRK